MMTVSKKILFGAALAAVMTACLATSFSAGAETAAPRAKAPAMQAQKPTAGPIPTASGKIKQNPVRIGDHWWVQFFDTVTGEHTGCHDKITRCPARAVAPATEAQLRLPVALLLGRKARFFPFGRGRTARR